MSWKKILGVASLMWSQLLMGSTPPTVIKDNIILESHSTYGQTMTESPHCHFSDPVFQTPYFTLYNISHPTIMNPELEYDLSLASLIGVLYGATTYYFFHLNKKPHVALQMIGHYGALVCALILPYSLIDTHVFNSLIWPALVIYSVGFLTAKSVNYLHIHD